MADDKFLAFFQLTKVDEAQRLVYGRATQEIPDGVREILDYEKSKPYFKAWSEAAEKRSGGKSKGNIREMHEPVAAGKVIDLSFNDAEKAIDIGTYCSDDSTWRKILDGTLTGFSVGGRYVERMPDMSKRGMIRYTADPQEISYVDSPAVPTATYNFIKADGTQELRKAVLPGVLDGAVDSMTLGENPADPTVPVKEENDPALGILNTIRSGEQVKDMPSVAGMAIAANMIDEHRAVEPMKAPKDEPVAKAEDQSLVERVAQIAQTFSSAVEKLDAMRKQDNEEAEKQVLKLKSVGKRVGIARRESEPLTPPHGLTSDLNKYGDPANYSFPLENKEQVQTAIAKFNSATEKEKYSLAEWNVLGRRIVMKASAVLGEKFQYQPKELKVIRKEQMANKLSKLDATGMLNQLSSVLGVAVDQIRDDPAAIADLLMQALGSVDSASGDMSGGGEPVAPTGTQADAADVTMKAAQTTGPTAPTATTATTPSTEKAMATPSSESSGSETDAYKTAMEKQAADMKALTETMLKVLEHLTGGAKVAEPVTKTVTAVTPLGDLAALVNAQQPTEEDKVLKLLASGDRMALRKAAELIGTPERPDVQGAINKAISAVTDNLSKGKFSEYYGQRYPGMFHGREMIQE